MGVVTATGTASEVSASAPMPIAAPPQTERSASLPPIQLPSVRPMPISTSISVTVPAPAPPISCRIGAT